MERALCRFDTRKSCQKTCPFFVGQSESLAIIAFEQGVPVDSIIRQVKLVSPVNPQFIAEFTPAGEPYTRYLCNRFYKQ